MISGGAASVLLIYRAKNATSDEKMIFFNRTIEKEKKRP
jgi:stress response protein SCP2